MSEINGERNHEKKYKIYQLLSQIFCVFLTTTDYLIVHRYEEYVYKQEFIYWSESNKKIIMCISATITVHLIVHYFSSDFSAISLVQRRSGD